MNELTNNPPTDADPIRDRLASDHEDLAKRIAEIEEALARVPEEVNDDATAEKAADFVKLAKAAAKTADGRREQEGRPYLDAKRTIDSWFKTLGSRADTAAKTVERRLNAFLARKREEERKRAEEEAARARAEAEKATLDEERAAHTANAERATARAADDKGLARTQTAYGTVSTRKKTVVTLEDRKKLPVKFLREWVDEEAIVKAARAAARAHRGDEPLAIPGIKIESVEEAYVR